MRVLQAIFVLFFTALATHGAMAQQASGQVHVVDPVTITSQMGPNTLVLLAHGACPRGQIGFVTRNDGDEDVYVTYSFPEQNMDPRLDVARSGGLFYEALIRSHRSDRVCVSQRFARMEHGEPILAIEANIHEDSTLAEKKASVSFTVNGRFTRPRR